jgi:Tol biopolymer transport system component
MENIMKRILFVIALVVLVGAGPSAQSGYELLQQALSKEQAEGKVAEAIVIYQRIAREFASDRALAAKALLRLGEAYQKLGDRQARGAFEALVRQYPDQNEATVARARLARSPEGVKPVEQALRLVGVSSGMSISRDGRRLVYFDGSNVGLHDLADGHKRLVTRQSDDDDHTAGAIISRDGSQLVYTWYTEDKNRYDLRLIATSGSGVPPARVLYDGEDVNVAYPLDWSPDGKSLAIDINRKDRTRQLALLSVGDGTVRVLKSTGWGGGGRAAFSADGRWLAVDTPTTSNRRSGDLFLLAVDGSRQQTVVEHPADDRLVGWSPAGDRLLFTSDRTGTRDLWGQRIDASKPTGAPQLLYSNIGEREMVGVTSAGGLFLRATIDEFDIEVATLDLATGQASRSTAKPAQKFVGTNKMPDWSRDGKYLAYLSTRTDAGIVIVVQHADTGEIVRELRPKLGYTTFMRWSPDGRRFAVSSSANGRIGVFLVDAESGETTTVTTPRDDFWRGFAPEWSPDGTRLYYRLPVENQVAVMERNLSSGAEREVFRRKDLGVHLSPDGRWFATRTDDGAAVGLVPVAGGATRELHKMPQGYSAVPVSWDSSGRGLIVRATVAGRDGMELWFVPVDGGQPRKIDLPVTTRKSVGPGSWTGGMGGFRLHPDGRRLAYTLNGRRREVWVLENFLPRTNETK